MIITGSTDGAVGVWIERNSKIHCISSLYYHNSQIKCLSSNKNIGIVVIVTLMNQISIASLWKLKLLCSETFEIKNQESPFLAIILEHPPLVVLFFRNTREFYAQSFSLTCQFQNEKQFNFAIVDACHVLDNISSLAVLTSQYQLVLMDPSTFEVTSVVFTSKVFLTRIIYHQETEQFLLSTNNHKLLSVPLHLDPNFSQEALRNI